MNREMMWYWGLVHIRDDYWISNNTARADHAPAERRQMPPDTGLTAAESIAVHHALGVLSRDAAWDYRLHSYSTALNVVCASWLDSCKAEQCFKLAEQTNDRRVYCPNWNMTMQCLDHETRYTQPDYLGDIGNWTSKWSYLTDHLPGVTGPLPVIQPRWWFLALLAHIIIALLHFVRRELEKYLEYKHKHDFKPQRVKQVQCRFRPPNYTIDAPGMTDANTSIMVDRLTRGNQIINDSFNITTSVGIPSHNHPWNGSVDELLADIVKNSANGSINWLHFVKEGYYTGMVNDIWSKIAYGQEYGESQIEFGSSNLTERAALPTIEEEGSAQLVNAAEAAGSLLLVGVVVVAFCRWRSRKRQADATTEHPTHLELSVMAKQVNAWSAASTRLDQPNPDTK